MRQVFRENICDKNNFFPEGSVNYSVNKAKNINRNCEWQFFVKNFHLKMSRRKKNDRGIWTSCKFRQFSRENICDKNHFFAEGGVNHSVEKTNNMNRNCEWLFFLQRSYIFVALCLCLFFSDGAGGREGR